MAATRIQSEIDFDHDGKHFGYLLLPHSVHRSAYGRLPIPVACIRNGEGPRVLIMAGNHGDEYEGQVAVSILARTLEPEQIQGRLILLPMANYPAALAGLRTSPIDNGNLNRSFPGDPDGTPTEMIAHYIEEVLIAESDFMFDLHSGGSSLLYLSSVQVEVEADGTLAPQTRVLAEAFGAPFTQVYRTDDNRLSESAARRKGIRYFTTELGGAGMVTPSVLGIAERGLARVLHTIGVLKELPEHAEEVAETRYVEVRGDHYVYAHEAGLFEPLVELGDQVQEGQPAAAIHFPETPWREPVIEHFQASGIVLCKRVPGRTERGDCLFHLGNDWPG